MARHIQSIERAAALLRVLGTAPHDLSLQEAADSLGLAKPTAHGILGTLRHIGMVEQDRRSGRYRLTHPPDWFPRGGIDPHLLRSHSMNWADSLAATTGEAVLIGVPGDVAVEVVHHVFRPDGSRQRLMYGEQRPAHASALGKVLLAHAAWWESQARRAPLERYTARTVVDRTLLEDQIVRARRTGYAVELAELTPEQAGVAAPIRAPGGLAVGAIGVFGPAHRLCVDPDTVRGDLVGDVVGAAAAVTAQLELAR